MKKVRKGERKIEGDKLNLMYAVIKHRLFRSATNVTPAIIM